MSPQISLDPVLVELSQISVRIDERDILKHVDFVLHEREIVTLIGPNGAGKSTLIKVLLGIVHPNAGDTAFIVDVTQAGIFLVDGVEEERLPYILGAYCPNILFPFLREAVNDMVTKGSFPQLLLTPINFDAEFEANMQRAQAAAVEGQA